MRKTIMLLLSACLLIAGTVVFADEDRQSRADAAVANILFDYDYGSEFATYRINEDGFVDIIMASNTPSEIYVEILNRMENHPDIDGVLASNSGPACKVSNW
jgi:hypothetical protein